CPRHPRKTLVSWGRQKKGLVPIRVRARDRRPEQPVATPCPAGRRRPILPAAAAWGSHVYSTADTDPSSSSRGTPECRAGAFDGAATERSRPQPRKRVI